MKGPQRKTDRLTTITSTTLTGKNSLSGVRPNVSFFSGLTGSKCLTGTDNATRTLAAKRTTIILS